jgi:hypothetical protein
LTIIKHYSIFLLQQLFNLLRKVGGQGFESYFHSLRGSGIYRTGALGGPAASGGISLKKIILLRISLKCAKLPRLAQMIKLKWTGVHYGEKGKIGIYHPGGFPRP